MAILQLPGANAGPAVDVVVVSYNSAAELGRCVHDVADAPDIQVTVVDNNSTDDSAAVARNLPVNAICLRTNHGFAHGCNVGWRAGVAPYVVFLNPDAEIDALSVRRLAAVLREDPAVGAVGPRIDLTSGELAFSQRRFPTPWSSLAQALFLHRLPGMSRRADDLIRARTHYDHPGESDWISGACIAVRRSDLERIGGWDDQFFMYREDIDLCRRLRASGLSVRFDPRARVVHLEGASAPRGRMIPILAASRLRYAAKHYGRLGAAGERLAVALHAATHAILGRGDRSIRVGHLHAMLVAVGVRRPASASARDGQVEQLGPASHTDLSTSAAIESTGIG